MPKANRFILAGNAGYYNRGSEAIIRGTSHILRHCYGDPEFIAVSHYKNHQQYRDQCLDETDPMIIHKKMRIPYKRFDGIWIASQILKRVYPSILKMITYKEMAEYLKDCDAVLAVGGDNYSLDYGEKPKTCTDLDDYVTSAGKPLVIWAASVGPFSKNTEYEQYMAKHLQKVHILAREPRTVQYLEKLGLTDNVYRVADPAFVMSAQMPETHNEIDDNAIGLNLSPLMSRFVTNGNGNKWLLLSKDIIQRLLDETISPIYLVPHVTGTGNNDDYKFMKEVLSRVNKNIERVTLLPPTFNAAESKWLIGKMRVFAGARTHSTIAAMSSCVPTLSFAYSIKAIGINEDVFGHSDYCISPEKITPELVFNKIQELLDNYKMIRNHLEKRIPEVQEMSIDAGRTLKKILKYL